MAVIDFYELGNRFRDVRRALDLTQGELSERLGVSRYSLTAVENGKTRCGIELVYKLCNLFDVNLDYLFFKKGNIFKRDSSQRHDPGNFGSDIDSMEDLSWYAERSPYLLHSVIAYATELILKNDEIIRNDVRNFEKKKEKS